MKLLSHIPKNKKSIVQILTYILILTLIIVSVVFLSLYFSIRNQQLENAYKQEQEIADNINRSVTVMNGYASNTLDLLYTNPHTMQLIYSNDLDNRNITNAMFRLRDVVQSSSWIHSAYIYNEKSGSFTAVYPSNTRPQCLAVHHKDDFFDSTILTIFNSQKVVASAQTFSCFRTLTLPNMDSITVFTYVLPVISNQSGYDGLFILNISSSQIFQFSNEFSNTDERQIMFMNSEGDYFFSNTSILAEVDSGTLLNEIEMADGDSGMYVMKHPKTICSWRKATGFPLYFISCVPYSIISMQLNSLTRWYLVFLVVILCFISFDVLYLTQGIRAYKTMQNQHVAVINQYNSNYHYIKNSLLRDLVIHGANSFQLQKLKENKIFLEDYAHYNLTIFSIKQSLQANGTPQLAHQDLFRFIQEQLEKFIPMGTHFELADMLQGTWLLIDDCQDVTELRAAICDFQEESSKLGFAYIASISEVGIHSLTDIPTEYNNITTKMPQLYFYPTNVNVLLSELEQRKIVGRAELHTISKELGPLIYKQDFAQVRTLFDDFFTHWYEPVADIQSTLSFCVSLFSTYANYITDTYGVGFRFDESNFLHTLIRANSSQRIKMNILNFLADVENVCASIDVNNENVNRVIRYLEAHYSDSNLTADSVMSALSLPSYQTQSNFKAITGESISVYLRQLRIRKGAQLLAETDLPIRDVALSVGYDNPNYFYTVFKQQYSLTPSNYRKGSKYFAAGEQQSNAPLDHE